MKVVTMVKKGWLAQSNRAQLNWPSFEASPSAPLADWSQDLHPRMAASRRDKTAVIGQQCCIQRLGQRQIDGIVGAQVMAKLPHPGQEGLMGMSLHRKVHEIGEQSPAAICVKLSCERVSAKHLDDL